MNKVETLIENLRSAFADVPKAKMTSVCCCDWCLGRTKADMLLAFADNIQLALEDEEKAAIVLHYLFDAIWTVGDALDFKYFVPKILELCLHEYNFLNREHPLNYSATLFVEKIGRAGFNDWRATQRAYVEAAIYDIIDQGIHAQSDKFDEWMSALCYLDVDHQNFVNLLDRDYAVVSRHHFVQSHQGSWASMRMNGISWDDVPHERTQIVHNWLVCQPPL